MQEEIKNLKILTFYQKFQLIYKIMFEMQKNYLKCRKNTENLSCKDKKRETNDFVNMFRVQQ